MLQGNYVNSDLKILKKIKKEMEYIIVDLFKIYKECMEYLISISGGCAVPLGISQRNEVVRRRQRDGGVFERDYEKG